MPQEPQDSILNEIHEDPSSSSCFSLAAKWLKACLINHDDCSLPSRDSRLPTRVLNVGDESRDPFLYEPPEDRRLGHWIPLSYCWGGEPTLKLKKETELRMRRGIPVNEFDRTICDAIVVTRALGIPYLWVMHCVSIKMKTRKIGINNLPR
jgi:hypothetical protein